MSNAIFTEVIDVELNSGPLEASLNSLISMYQEKLKELSTSGLDSSTMGGLNVAGITADLQAVRGELKTLTDAFMESFGSIAAASQTTGNQVGASLSQAMEEVDTKAKSSIKTQLEDLSQLASGSEEAWNKFAQAAQAALSDGFDPRVRMTADLVNNLFTLISSGGREAFEQLTAQQQDWVISYQSALAKVEDSIRLTATEGTEAWQAEQQKQVAMVEQATTQMEAEFKRRAVASDFIDADSDAFQKDQQRQVAAVESATKLMEADFAKRRELANDVSVEGTDAWQQAQMKEVAVVEQATKLMEADFARRKAAENDANVEGTDAWQQAQMKQVAAVEQATKLMEADFAKRAAASNDAAVEGTEAWQQAQMKQVAMVEQATKMMQADFAQRSESSNGFFSGLTDQLTPEALGRMAGYVVVFGAIYKAIQLASDAAKAFVGFFETGVTYLSDLEERSASLQGVLATNVQYSKDQAENFRLAGVSAENINKQIQDNAIRYGANIDVLTRGFKSFVDNGGVALTHSVDDALQASTLLTVAIKASGKDAETTRAALSEIPKLLDGTITSSSKILETLGLSTTEWKNMLSEATSQRDLLEQLTSRLSDFQQVAANSANRFDALKQSIELIYDRTAALAAQQFWPTLKGILEDLKQGFEDNKEKIDAVAIGLGDVVDGILKLINTKSDVNGFVTVFQTLAIGISNLSANLQQLAVISRAVYAALNLAFTAADYHATTGYTAEQKKAMNDDLAFLTTYSAQQKKIFDDHQQQVDEINGKQPLSHFLTTQVDDPDSYGQDQSVTKGPADNTKASKAAITALRAEYQKLFAETKTDADKEKEQIAQSLAQRLISVQTASQLTIEADNKEYESQLKLIALYKEKATTVAAPVASKNSFIGALSKQQEQLSDVNNKAVAAQQQKAITDALKVQDEGLQKSEAAVNKDAAQQIAIITAREKAGLLPVSQGADQEIAIETRRHNIIEQLLMEEVTNAGENDALRTAATAKLDAEDQAHTAKVQQNAAKRTEALMAEMVAADTASSKIAHAQYESDVAAAEANQRVTATQIQNLESTQRLAEEYTKVAQSDLVIAQNELAYAVSLGKTGTALDVYTAKLAKAQAEKAKAATSADKANKAVVQSNPAVAALQENFSDWKTLFDDFTTDNKTFTQDLKSFSSDLSDVMTSATAAITAATKEFTTIGEAIQKGGALGGVGAGLSAAGGTASAVGGIGKELQDSGVMDGLSKGLQSMFSAAPVIGSLISAAGGLITAISAIFTAAAKRIAENIDKEFQTTVQAYNNGAATLQATLQAVQGERTDAIAQLSNQKGGQDQLDKLLPQLDSEIAQLEQQQKQIITNFETSLQKLQLHSTVLSQTLDTWTSINQQVQDYINAGGDAAKAAQFLSESLEAIKEDAATNLQSGDKDAITEALQYNDLLVQRQALTDAYNKSKFDTLNADALERRASNAVDVGLTQKAADTSYQSSLTDLNSQIDLASTEVSMYRQIYDIASDTATLKAQSNALEIASLATQISSLKDYAQVYNSIYQTPNGTYTTGNAAGTGASTGDSTVNVGTIAISINGGGSTIDGVTLAQTLRQELSKTGRYGVTPAN